MTLGDAVLVGVKVPLAVAEPELVRDGVVGGECEVELDVVAVVEAVLVSVGELVGVADDVDVLDPVPVGVGVDDTKLPDSSPGTCST